MIKIHDILQGSDKWFELRKGKLTSSKATCIAANGKGLETYCKEIVLELIGIEPESYMNDDMQRGNDLESLGISAYELDTGLTVNKVGFCTNEEYKETGASPDGLIGEDGGVEIKARNDKKHFGLMLGDKTDIPFNQIQMS